MDRFRWQDGLAVLVGVLLMTMPFVIGDTLPPGVRGAWVMLSLVLSGLAVFGLSISAWAADQGWEEWVSALVGVWLVASPWVLGFSSVAVLTWGTAILGLATIVLAIWSFRDYADRGHA